MSKRNASEAAIRVIEDADQYDDLIAESQSKLVIVDLYAGKQSIST